MGTKNLHRSIILVAVLFAQLVYSGQWANHNQDLQNMVAAISDMELEIKKLIQEKRNQHNRDAQTQTMKEIQEKHKKLEEAYKKYNEEVTHVLYRHPEQGNENERVYRVLQPKTLEQIESDVGLDGKLDRIKRNMVRQYNQPPPPKKEEVKAVKKHVDESKAKERIILRK